MPRIDASNIAEHVRIQDRRVLDAAQALLEERGYADTDMGDIAEAVGLARSSLYRYYPSKDHIVVACVKRAMAPVLDRLQVLRDAHADPVARIHEWLAVQLAFATGPEHATVKLIGEIRHVSPGLQQDIAALHEEPAAVLREAVEAVTAQTGRDPALVMKLISGVVNAGATHALESGQTGEVHQVLLEMIDSLLGVSAVRTEAEE